MDNLPENLYYELTDVNSGMETLENVPEKMKSPKENMDNVIEKMNGSIQVASEPETGSSFMILLPQLSVEY